MRTNFRLLILLLPALTIGCAMPVQSNPTPMKSSTQGSTLVRMATIIAVGSSVVVDVAGETAVAGDVIASNPDAPPGGQSARTRTVTELLLRLDDGNGNGAPVAYRIEPGAVFQPGERVKVMTRSGHIRITH